MLSTDSADSADSAVDGVRLAELIDQLPLSRGSVFELVKALGITTAKGPGPNGKGRVAWLTASDAQRLSEAAAMVHAGKARIADLALGLQHLQTQQTAQTDPATASAASAESTDPAPFLARLQAADLAMKTGLGLTTAEASWIIGVRPGAAVVVRGGVVAERQSRNHWKLSAAEQTAPGAV